MPFEISYPIGQQKNSVSNKCKNEINQALARPWFGRSSLGIVLLILFSAFSSATLAIFLLLPEVSDMSEIKINLKVKAEIIPRNRGNYSTHHIYIDIGCFQAETIEYFLHFTPNSTSYDIIIFESDPTNYQLCRQRLQNNKYKNINVTILQKAAWIRDEKILLQVERGQQSRINITTKGNILVHKR